MSEGYDLIQLGRAIEHVLTEPGLFQVTFSAISAEGLRLRVTISIDLRKASLTAAILLKALSWASKSEVERAASSG